VQDFHYMFNFFLIIQTDVEALPSHFSGGNAATICVRVANKVRPKPSIYTPPQARPTTYDSSMGPTAAYPTATGGYNATVTSAPGPYPTSVSLSACASVAQLAAADPAATPIIPAKIAYECITSVPFNSSAATELLTSIRPYLNWQTTVDYIRDPPAEYAEKVQKPYDFYGEFNRIYEKADGNGYDNEFEFGFDLYEAVSSSWMSFVHRGD
jgi:hypothetical protein